MGFSGVLGSKMASSGQEFRTPDTVRPLGNREGETRRVNTPQMEGDGKLPLWKRVVGTGHSELLRGYLLLMLTILNVTVDWRRLVGTHLMRGLKWTNTPKETGQSCSCWEC